MSELDVTSSQPYLAEGKCTCTPGMAGLMQQIRILCSCKVLKLFAPSAGLVTDWLAFTAWKGAQGISRLLELASDAQVQVRSSC